MKNGKKPTRNQKKATQGAGLDPNEWLVTKVSHEAMMLVSRNGSTVVEVRG